LNIVDVIIKKRDRKELSEDEIKFFIDGVVDSSIQDYQISALLMAILLNGMTEKETASLTIAMAYSGKTLNLSQIDGLKVDKHSTGGVADTTTLILAPLVASLGVPVVKMSGRGLGHTGGTLDKLESIPNFDINVTEIEAINFAKKSGIVIMGQNESLTPADQKLYALRDVTGTVDSIPLIAASIMSKKIAAGADSIVLDVKCGSGAFMKNIEDARKLAKEMVSIGKNIDKKVMAVISNMDQPLGMYVGNSLEVIEAIEVLKGNIKGDLLDVSLLLGAYMLKQANITSDLEVAKNMLLENIQNGKGLEKFEEMINQQNGNSEIIKNYNLMPKATVKTNLICKKSGYVYSMESEKIGRAFIETGAGRKIKTDIIDYGAGVIMKVRLGDKVLEGDILAEIFASTELKCSSAVKFVQESIVIMDKQPVLRSLILDIIE
jgi:pyrimidine-nucleoside phosphorylase